MLFSGAAVFFLAFFGRVTGELYDIRAKLYRDENCFEETDPLILFAGGSCYAQYWSNISKGFTIHVVSLTKPKRMVLSDYSDHCRNEISSRLVYEEECSEFYCSTNDCYYGRFTISLRVNCYGRRDCKSITTAEQIFYNTASCDGGEYMDQTHPVSTIDEKPEYDNSFGTLPTKGMPSYEEEASAGFDYDEEDLGEIEPEKSPIGEKYSYEAWQNENRRVAFPQPQRSASDACLRAINGTVMYMRKFNGSQVHEFLFDLSDDCTPLEHVGYRWYAYTVGYCYPMQNGKSYKWYVDRVIADSLTISRLGLAALLTLFELAQRN
jgi:hypothetical protein